MKNILLRANPLGVVAVLAITFVYVGIQPEYPPAPTDAGSALLR